MEHAHREALTDDGGDTQDGARAFIKAINAGEEQAAQTVGQGVEVGTAAPYGVQQFLQKERVTGGAGNNLAAHLIGDDSYAKLTLQQGSAIIGGQVAQIPLGSTVALHTTAPVKPIPM